VGPGGQEKSRWDGMGLAKNSILISKVGSENTRNWANLEDILVWFFANTFCFIMNEL
jgi:hypothetical protein